MLHYRYHWIEETLQGSTLDRLEETGEDLSESHFETEVLPTSEGDLEDVLRETESECWDSEDWRTDAVLFYPADDHQDFRTGDRLRRTLVVEGSEDDLESLESVYRQVSQRTSPASLDDLILFERARREGIEHGRDAASWYFDFGRAPSWTDARSVYRRVLQGLEDGDPEVIDTLPSSPLSGEWADGLQVSDVLSLLDLEDEDDLEPEYVDEVLRAFEDGYSEGAYRAIEREAAEGLRSTPVLAYVAVASDWMTGERTLQVVDSLDSLSPDTLHPIETEDVLVGDPETLERTYVDRAVSLACSRVWISLEDFESEIVRGEVR